VTDTDVARWLESLARGDDAGVVNGLLEEFATSRSPGVASIIALLTPPRPLTSQAQTQADLAQALAAAPVDVVATELERAAATFSAANLARILDPLTVRPPDPRLGALALKLVSEAGAVRELSVPIAGLLAGVFLQHAHAGLKPAYDEAQERLSGVRTYVYEKFFNAHTAAALKAPAKRIADAELAPLERAAAQRRQPQGDGGGAALLEAVIVSPDDDGARAVYADWLLQRGDERGELISLQLKRAGGRGVKGSAALEKALLLKHRAAWLGPLNGAVALASLKFERGFPAKAELTRVPEDPRWVQLLTTLELNVRDLKPLAEGRHTRFVRSLTVACRPGLDAAVEALSFTSFTRLHTLTLLSILEHTNDVLPPLFRLGSLDHLTRLRLQRGVSGTPRPDVLEKAWPGLEQIELVDSGKLFVRGSAEWPDARAR
jgi:uncharacterized protein (TIGR02996 family)